MGANWQKLKEQIACELCERKEVCDSYPTIDGEPKHPRCAEQLKKADLILSPYVKIQADAEKAGWLFRM